MPITPSDDPNASQLKVPYFGTGASAFIRIGGKPVAVCTDLRWQISYQPTPIHTVDTVHPWDIDVGPMSVSITLSRILDPNKGPEVDHLLPIMSSAIHHPMVEIQVLNRASDPKNNDPSTGNISQNLQNRASSFVNNVTGQSTDKTKLTTLFFAKGMFLSVNGSVAKSQVSNISAQFIGIAYQHNVSQVFKPYSSVASGLSGLVQGLGGLVSTFTGG